MQHSKGVWKRYPRDNFELNYPYVYTLDNSMNYALSFPTPNVLWINMSHKIGESEMKMSQKLKQFMIYILAIRYKGIKKRYY